MNTKTFNMREHRSNTLAYRVRWAAESCGLHGYALNEFRQDAEKRGEITMKELEQMHETALAALAAAEEALALAAKRG